MIEPARAQHQFQRIDIIRIADKEDILRTRNAMQSPFHLGYSHGELMLMLRSFGVHTSDGSSTSRAWSPQGTQVFANINTIETSTLASVTSMNHNQGPES